MVDLISLKKTVKENLELKDLVKVKTFENNKLAEVMGQMEQQMSNLKEDNNYLINQIREAQKTNDDLTTDLETSTEQNQELITRITQLQ